MLRISVTAARRDGAGLFHARPYWRKKGEKLRIHSKIEHRWNGRQSKTGLRSSDLIFSVSRAKRVVNHATFPTFSASPNWQSRVIAPEKGRSSISSHTLVASRKSSTIRSMDANIFLKYLLSPPISISSPSSQNIANLSANALTQFWPRTLEQLL